MSGKCRALELLNTSSLKKGQDIIFTLFVTVGDMNS